MRRSHRRQSPIVRGPGLPRLLSMLVTLAVVCLLMARAKDPSTWRWLTGESPSSGSFDSKTDGTTEVVHDHAQDDPDASLEATSAPPEEDPEEAEAAREEFQAISDGTLWTRPEEMPAYRRLLDWVERQPLEMLQHRARRDVLFNQLMQSPTRYRGQLIHLELHLRMVSSFEPGENPTGAEHLYEAWGWSNESKAWLYVVLFSELPPGMPVGPDVYETASFDGYFFKLQGYHEAGAKPHDPPLVAPLLIGRLVWHPVRLDESTNANWFWVALVGGALILLVTIASWTWSYVSRSSRPLRSHAHSSKRSIENWLEQAETGWNRSEPEDDSAAGRPGQSEASS